MAKANGKERMRRRRAVVAWVMANLGGFTLAAIIDALKGTMPGPAVRTVLREMERTQPDPMIRAKDGRPLSFRVLKTATTTKGALRVLSRNDIKRAKRAILRAPTRPVPVVVSPPAEGDGAGPATKIDWGKRRITVAAPSGWSIAVTGGVTQLTYSIEP